MGEKHDGQIILSVFPEFLNKTNEDWGRKFYKMCAALYHLWLHDQPLPPFLVTEVEGEASESSCSAWAQNGTLLERIQGGNYALGISEPEWKARGSSHDKLG